MHSFNNSPRNSDDYDKAKTIRKVSELESNNRNLNARLHSMSVAINAARVGFWEMDLSSGNFHISASYAAMLGYKTDKLTQSFETILNLLHPDDVDLFFSNHINFLTNPETRLNLRFRMRDSNGNYRLIQSSGFATSLDSHGRPSCISGIDIDIDYKQCPETKTRTNCSGVYPLHVLSR